MTLTSARGPLGPDPAGRFIPAIAPGTVLVEPHQRRVQAFVGDHAVIDTERALLVHRPGHPPAYAFDPADVDGVGATPHPFAPGHVEVAWDAVDRWVEEGRVAVHYPPNPYHRIDCRATGRRLQVAAGERSVVDTTDTVGVFETALAPVLYVDRTHLAGRLVPTSTRTYCSYKGWASYWTIRFDDGPTLRDACWSYEDPFAEAEPIRGLLAFDSTVVTVDADVPR